MYGKEPRHHAWRGARARTDIELLLDRTEIGIDRVEVELARWSPLAWCLGEEIEQRDLVTSRPPRHEEAAAARRGKHGFRNEGHEQAGDAGVKGVAAILQNFRRGGGSQLMTCRDHALSLAHARGLRRSARCGKSGALLYRCPALARMSRCPISDRVRASHGNPSRKQNEICSNCIGLARIVATC